MMPELLVVLPLLVILLFLEMLWELPLLGMTLVQLVLEMILEQLLELRLERRLEMLLLLLGMTK